MIHYLFLWLEWIGFPALVLGVCNFYNVLFESRGGGGEMVAWLTDQ